MNTPSFLIISRDAGGLTKEVADTIVSAFSSSEVMDFDSAADYWALIPDGAQVIIAGGDGTIGALTRALARRAITLGLLPIGTNNNFAAALGLPDRIEDAIDVIHGGRAVPITLGEVNGHYFLETASIGLFGKTIVLGEAVKDAIWRDLPKRALAVMRAKPFRYSLAGNIKAHGQARSLVFSNTPTTGAQMPVGDTTPVEITLELGVQVGASRKDLLGRLLGSIFLDRHVDPDGMKLRFSEIEVETSPLVDIYLDNMKVARTPARVVAVPNAISVILPK